MAKLFLLPIILCLVWTLFLHFNGVPLKQGKKGFIYILAISATVILSLGFLLWITAEQNIRG
ncbi:hypothetical protein FM038_017745 [Shewanella eurypsychrophilus]|uniref:Uncharacterized protein n=1 Tax=Shewanella eurypsychrophilus TaxID=2593656 RepID=A0ABX6V8S4_9GAMM|nr:MULTISPECIES: hypothetical protein [Shewanella]QFU23826.1 hypothetical protein FS418_19520 [Shewanella sp. YLB-09]QPG59048.1 hypothetical protein FM038_017745 [Shewanella eurypsychrophilus]